MRPGLRGQLMLGLLGGGLLLLAVVIVLQVAFMEAGRALSARAVGEGEAALLDALIVSDEGVAPCVAAERLGLSARLLVPGEESGSWVDCAGVPRDGSGVMLPSAPGAMLGVDGRSAPGREWAALRRGMVLFPLLLLLFGLLVAHLVLTRWVTVPLRRLGRAMQRVAAGRTDERVPPGGRAELVELTASFNRMLDHLMQARASLEARMADLGEANRALREARQEAMRAEHLASVGRLAAGLAHELGNPLAAVRGMVELVESGLQGEGDRDLLRRASGELERMSSLLRELMVYARPADLAVSEVDAREVAHNAVALVRHDPRAREVEVKLVASDDSSGLAWASEDALLQVLMNLLLNACDASASGGRIEVRVGSEEPGGVRVQVVDEGTGMAPEVLATAMEPFFTTKGPGEGTGLGLSLCERLVSEMGGRLALDSAVGRGTTATVWLREACAPAQASEPEAPGSGGPSGK